MLRGRSAVVFFSFVSSGAASSFLRPRRRLSPLLSLKGGPLQQPARRRAAWTDSSPFSMPQRGLICNRGKYDHVTPLFCDVLHWLPVPFRIEYKLCLSITSRSCRKVIEVIPARLLH